MGIVRPVSPTAVPVSRTRCAISIAAVVATLPYLVLKVDWVLGGTAGMTDPVRLSSATYRVANAATILLDVGAATFALVLVRPWGRRAPALLVTGPMWCATGLLGTIVLLLPAALLASLAGPQPQAAGLSLWVYVLVYTGFALQGVLLLVGSWYYTVDRWPALQRPRSPAPPTRTQGVWILVAAAVALTAVVQALWSFDPELGLGPLADRLSAVDRVTLATHALLAGSAALGTVRMSRSVTTRSRRTALLLAWLGTSATVTWGLYFLAYSRVNPDTTSPALTVTTAVAVILTGVLLCPLVASLRFFARSAPL